MTKEPKGTHGGARPGSGRKPQPGCSRMKPRSIKATDWEWNELKARAALYGMTVGRYLVERGLEG